MELLGGLAFLGHMINKKSNSTNDKYVDNKNINNKNNNKNLYNNDKYNESVESLRKEAKKKSLESKNFKNSGVVPPYYNSNRSITKKKFDPFDEPEDNNDNNDNNDSEFSDLESYNNKSCDNGLMNLGDSMCFYNKQEQFKNVNKNTFLDQFDNLTFDNASAPVALNSTSNIIGDNGNKRLALERNLALHEGFSNFDTKTDQTYNIVSKENFVHNNMTPFFSSKDGGFNSFSELKHIENTQRKLETFTGSANNLEYRPRTERKELFDPVIGLSNMYGTPVLTDVLDSRYVPSLEKRNERPFQETKVTPGLNLGYNEVGKFGYHDIFRALPKTVDELRTNSNRKQTYCGVVIPGMKGQKGSIPSKMYKRRPLTFWETTPSEYIRGQSYIKGPAIYGNVDSKNLATVNRGVANNGRLGGPKLFTDLHRPELLMEKTRISTKENFTNDNKRNIHKQEAKIARGNDETYCPKETLRSAYIKNERLGNIGNSEYKKQYVADTVSLIPDITMRNIHDRLDRAGNMGNIELNKGYVYDGKNWIPDPTMRNVHDKYDRAGNIGNPQIDKNYIYDGTNWIPDPNMRNVHDKYDRAGNIGNPQIDKNYIYDGTNWIPDPNMRNVHDKYDRAGNIGNPQIDKNYIYDGTNWIPDPNMRNVHDKYDRAGNIGNTQIDKSYAFDGTNWIPDPNMRNVHDKYDRAGNIGNTQIDKSYALDETNWIPDPNMRNVHDKYDRAGQIGNTQLDKGYIYDGTNMVPDPNMRNMHDKYDRAGYIGNAQLDKQFVFDMVNNVQDPTMRNIHDKYDRAGYVGNSQLDKGYIYDGTNWVPDLTMRNLHDKYDRAGQIGNAQLEKQFVFDMVNNISKPTMRDIHGKYDRAGVIGPNKLEKQRNRGDANNMRLNTVKEQVSVGRKPTECNYNKGPTVNFTMMNLKEPLNFNRDIYPDIKQTTTDKLGFDATRAKNTLPPQSFQFYSFIDENLRGNHLVNNIVHKSPIK
jgi:hypothetical protein